MCLREKVSEKERVRKEKEKERERESCSRRLETNQTVLFFTRKGKKLFLL